jgi:ribosome-binding factor A
VGRVSELVRTILVDALQTRISDPRLEAVTITQVTVTPDTTRADVYYTVMGDEETRQSAQDGLESAAGRLRREVGARTRLRNTPALVFHWDPSLDYGDRIEQLLDELGLGQEDDDEAQ